MLHPFLDRVHLHIAAGNANALLSFDAVDLHENYIVKRELRSHLKKNEPDIMQYGILHYQLSIMKIRSTLIAFILICSQLSIAQQLSDQAQISVITCGPTQEEVYSAFGHSAFRVYDPQLGIDDAFNYGVFSFNQPNFYLNFAKGYLNYKLGVQNYQDFKNYYIYNNRYVHEQILNLTNEQKQELYAYLLWNAKPENEYYLYDYFYDNCSTRIRDVIIAVFKNEVIFDGSYIKTKYTIRELTDFYLTKQPWGDLGIDIGLGLPMDKKASPYEYMFLPDYLESGFDHASIKHSSGKVNLVKETIKVYESRDEDSTASLFHPLFVFSFIAIAAAALMIYDLKRKKLSTWFDIIIFGTVGLLGVALLLLWFATDHKAAANNLNIMWALPTHIIATFAFIKQPKWLMKYFLGVAFITGSLLIAWPIFPQKLNNSLIPLVLTLGMRAFTQYKVRLFQSKK